MRRQKTNSPSPLVLHDSDGYQITDPQNSAEAFAKQFAEVFTPPITPTASHFLPPCEVPMLTTVTFTSSDFNDALFKTNSYGAMGPDAIHPRLLKESSAVISERLAHLFRCSLSSGILPPPWKQVIVVPIYKSGDRHSPTNYRPISLTSIPCKLMERIIKRTLLDHLIKYGLISKFQHGFLPNRSCVTNMLAFMESLTEAYDRGQVTEAIFFDFAKAFDKVPHSLLIHKLQSYRIQGPLLHWLEQFLKGRSYQVRVNDCLSQPREVLSGVPQGSVLGPLLFLIYVNDLPSQLLSHKLFYADDLKTWTSADPSALQKDLDTIMDWSSLWSLPINPSKCCHMSFGGSHTRVFHLNTTPEKTEIHRTQLKKDLGIWLSTDFSLNVHHQNTAKPLESFTSFGVTFQRYQPATSNCCTVHTFGRIWSMPPLL